MEDGDTIVIDAGSRAIDWQVGEEEKARRRAAWEGSGKNALKERRGVLFRYARDVAVSSPPGYLFWACLPRIFSLLAKEPIATKRSRAAVHERDLGNSFGVII